MEYIKSCFDFERHGLSRILFDSIGTGLIKYQDELKKYLEGSLMYQ
jgi:hypothetical protein